MSRRVWLKLEMRWPDTEGGPWRAFGVAKCELEPTRGLAMIDAHGMWPDDMSEAEILELEAAAVAGFLDHKGHAWRVREPGGEPQAGLYYLDTFVRSGRTYELLLSRAGPIGRLSP